MFHLCLRTSEHEPSSRLVGPDPRGIYFYRILNGKCFKTKNYNIWVENCFKTMQVLKTQEEKEEILMMTRISNNITDLNGESV